MPIARRRLIEITNSSGGVKANNALSLLFHFGTSDDLAMVTEVTRLSLASQPVMDATLVAVRYIPRLTHLNLFYTAVTHRGLSVLVGMPLESLVL